MRAGKIWRDRQRGIQMLESFCKSLLRAECRSERRVRFGIVGTQTNRGAQLLFGLANPPPCEKDRRVVVTRAGILRTLVHRIPPQPFGAVIVAVPARRHRAKYNRDEDD